MRIPFHSLAGPTARLGRRKRGSSSTSHGHKPRALQVERLEDRRLLTGTTIITHGQWGDVDVDPWIDSMSDAIRLRVPNVPGSSGALPAEYTFRVSGGSPSFANSELELSSPVTAEDSPSGEAVIKIDWSEEARELFPTESTELVGRFVADQLLDNFGDPNGYTFLAGPVHMIGHSRGTSVNAAIAQRLAERGVWIDQFTTLDPHPVEHAGDTPITLWDNIRFADNYWRDGLFIGNVPVGQDVGGSYSVTFEDGDLNGGYGDRWLADHSDVHLWYHGTIDTETEPIDDGGASVSASAEWYEEERGPRDGNGFYFSRIAGGDRTGVASEGIATANNRSTVPNPAPDRWANLDASLSYQAGFCHRGFVVEVGYRYQASDPCTITFGYDSDRNPFNGATDRGSVTRLATGSVGQFDDGSTEKVYRLNTNRIPYGAHYLYAKIESAHGHVRYAYGTEQITVGLGLPDWFWPRPPLHFQVVNSVQAIGSQELAGSAVRSVGNRADLMTPVMQDFGRLPSHKHDHGDQPLNSYARRLWDESNLLLEYEFELDALCANHRVNHRAVDAFFTATAASTHRFVRLDAKAETAGRFS